LLHYAQPTADRQLINMHELSIALSMIEMATEEAQRVNALRINAIHLKIGPLSGVVKDALMFSFEVASAGTLLEGSSLLIEDTPVVIYCDECKADRQLDSIQRFSCPVCGTLSAQIVRGKELEFVAMEIEEADTSNEEDEPREKVAGLARFEQLEEMTT
jgi:hydrogenase nickel incorporation protein HypA/HybF